MTAPLRSLTAGLAIGALVGLALGWQLWRPLEVTETPAAEERRPDGSVVLERAPDPRAQPAAPLPAGTTLERRVTVRVQPQPVVRPPLDSTAVTTAPLDTAGVPRETANLKLPVSSCSCEPVTVHLDIVRDAGGARRVVASAEGGVILGGVDVPVDSPPIARTMRWGVGPAWDPIVGGWGASVSRDLDRLPIPLLRLPARLGVTVIRPAPGDRAPRLGIRLELRF